MPGKQKPTPLPMHRYPLTLVRIARYDEWGVQVGQYPLWLLVIGQQRHAKEAAIGVVGRQHRLP